MLSPASMINNSFSLQLILDTTRDTFLGPWLMWTNAEDIRGGSREHLVLHVCRHSYTHVLRPYVQPTRWSSGVASYKSSPFTHPTTLDMVAMELYLGMLLRHTTLWLLILMEDIELWIGMYRAAGSAKVLRFVSTASAFPTSWMASPRAAVRNVGVGQGLGARDCFCHHQILEIP